MAVNYGRLISVKMDDELLQRIDMWRREQTDLPTRSEAIRRILAEHLPALPRRRARIRSMERD